ncbi:MAG: peptidylprolyl isomerase [Leptospirales bacterium]
MKTGRSSHFLQAEKRTAILLGVCFSLLLSACNHPRPNKDAVVANLGNHPITVEDLETTALFMGLGGKSDKPPEQWSPAMRNLILRETVQDVFLLQYATNKRLRVLPEEQRAFNSKHFSTSGNHPSGFTRKRILLEKAENRLTPIQPISSSAIALFYRRHPELFLIPKTALVDHIVVAREDEARTLHDALIKGGSFSRMAHLESLGTEATSGGRMKPYSLGALPPPFDIVFSMKPGEISDVLSSPYGYHLFRLVQIRPEHSLPISDVRRWIKEQLRHQQISEFLQTWTLQKLQAQPLTIAEKYRGIFSSQFEYNGLAHSETTHDIHHGDTQNPK